MTEKPYVGMHVGTPQKHPSGHGKIVTISECGRYVVVKKAYGPKRWKEQYKVSDVECLEKK
jgi:hypothetical protein